MKCASARSKSLSFDIDTVLQTFDQSERALYLRYCKTQYIYKAEMYTLVCGQVNKQIVSYLDRTKEVKSI
jgi:hypothetical protein